MYTSSEALGCACGIELCFDFTDEKRLYNMDISHIKGGAGFALLAYVDDTICYKMYEAMAKKYPILYQSPVRKNLNSGNDFFFCIYAVSQKATY